MSVQQALDHARATVAALEALQAAEAAPAPVAPAAPETPVSAPETGAVGLTDPGAFFAHLRGTKVLGPDLTQPEVDGCNAILAACAGKMPTSWAAYALATAYHETAHTMQPINEYGGNAYFHRMYDPEGQRPDAARKNGNTQPGDGVRYHGRGYVQLTWRNNYRRAGEAIGQPLEDQPDLALRPDVAGAVLVQGILQGWYNPKGKGIRAYVPAEPTREHFVNARTLVNLSDKADLIAGYALTFYEALKVGGWR